MVKNLGKWKLVKLHIYHPLSGVTANQSEALNRVLKGLHDWKEVPIDVMVLSLFQLQTYYHNEVQRGLCGIGKYTLKPQYLSLSRSTDELDLLKCEDPRDIVRHLKASTSDMQKTASAGKVTSLHS